MVKREPRDRDSVLVKEWARGIRKDADRQHRTRRIGVRPQMGHKSRKQMRLWPGALTEVLCCSPNNVPTLPPCLLSMLRELTRLLIHVNAYKDVV